MSSSGLSIFDWRIILNCGKELCGCDMGSFSLVKFRTDIVALYVKTGAGNVFAKTVDGVLPLRWDFFVRVGLGIDDGSIDKVYRLVAVYGGYRISTFVHPDGRHHSVREQC